VQLLLALARAAVVVSRGARVANGAASLPASAKKITTTSITDALTAL
jgi:hypothetical protein